MSNKTYDKSKGVGNQEEKWRFEGCIREKATEKINVVISHFLALLSVSTYIKLAVASGLLLIYCFIWSNFIVLASKIVCKLSKT